MDGMFAHGLAQFDLLARRSVERRIATKAVLLTVAMAVVTISVLLGLDRFGLQLPVVEEFPTVLDVGP